MGYLLEGDHGLSMPRGLQIEFSQIIQKIADDTCIVISSLKIWESFQEIYFKTNSSFNFLEHHIESSSQDKAQEDSIKVKILKENKEHIIKGVGNGPIDAFINAIKQDLNLSIKVLDYHQHAISTGSDAKAVAYIEIQKKGKSSWGVGMHTNTVIAGLLSVISGLNKIASS